jgi:DNA mismatch repair ATPase MutS
LAAGRRATRAAALAFRGGPRTRCCARSSAPATWRLRLEPCGSPRRAAGCLLQYVRDTQKPRCRTCRGDRRELRDEALQIDAATRRNLELDTSLAGRGRQR